MTYFTSNNEAALRAANSNGPAGWGTAVTQWGEVMEHPEGGVWMFGINEADVPCFLNNNPGWQPKTAEELAGEGWVI